MKNGVIYFAHGKESGPWGIKIKALAQIGEHHGLDIISPDYRFSMDPQERIDHLIELAADENRLILVGSSMGGYVSALAAEHLEPLGLFLMAPAFFLPDYPNCPKVLPHVTEIVHGWHDEVVPVESAIELGRRFACTTHIINGSHTLNDNLDEVSKLFEGFLSRFKQLVD